MTGPGNSLGLLYRLLAPLRLYALGRNSAVDHELAAYGAGLALLEERLARLEADILPQTASAEGLARHEAAMGLPVRGQLSDGARRALILARRERPPLPTPAGAVALLERAGLIEPLPREEDGALVLTARAVAPGLEACAWALAAAALPAHLALTERFGPDWNTLDAAGLCWDALDLLGRSWA